MTLKQKEDLQDMIHPSLSVTSSSLSKAIELAQTIKAVIFDVDGVLFSSKVHEGMTNAEGKPMKVKVRSYNDGQGISLLRAIGIHVAFVTTEKDADAAPVVSVVDKWNNLPSSNRRGGTWFDVLLYTGRGGEKKIEAASAFLEMRFSSFKEAAAMGDDLVDVPLLKKVGLPVAPAQAERVVRQMALFISRRNGGEGAIRDFADFILAVRGIDPTTLPPF